MSALPLVLVHGFMGGGDQWELQRDGLSKTQELITIDLPGFGKKNQMQSPNTIKGYAQYVLDYLSERNIETFNLLGHSMGGMIVQEMVALASERIKQLVIYASAATGNLPQRFETFATSKQRVEEDGVEASARRISATWFVDYEEAAQFKNCAKVAEQSSLQAMLAALDAMEGWTREENLPNISCPTLIIWGELDRTYHWPQIEQLWKCIEGVNLAVVPNCAHAVHMEKPELFNVILSDFLKNLSAKYDMRRFV